MSWISQNYEKAAVGGGLAVAIALAACGWSKWSGVESDFSSSLKGTGGKEIGGLQLLVADTPTNTVGGIDRSPWRRVVNPFRPVEVLSVDQVEAIHQASLRILSEIGLEVLGAGALDQFAADGASVDRATRTVRLDPARVEELVALAPSTFTLHARNPERDDTLPRAPASTRPDASAISFTP